MICEDSRSEEIHTKTDKTYQVTKAEVGLGNIPKHDVSLDTIPPELKWIVQLTAFGQLLTFVGIIFGAVFDLSTRPMSTQVATLIASLLVVFMICLIMSIGHILHRKSKLNLSCRLHLGLNFMCIVSGIELGQLFVLFIMMGSNLGIR